MLNKRLLIIMAVSTIIFTGCSSKKELTNADEDKFNGISSKEEIILYQNPLTGEHTTDSSILNKRPIAFMVNNIKQSLPQRGISNADIIYELPVEGAITRMMAVYSDIDNIPEIGSIRSARHDFVELALPIDAIYMHFGGSQAGKDFIAKNKVDSIDGLVLANTAFYKDAKRASKNGSEHSYFTNSELVKAGIEKKDISTTTDKKRENIFNFSKEEFLIDSPNKVPAINVVAPLSNGCTATFTYDENTKMYSKGQYGEPHLDENINKAVSSTNVFLLYTDVTYLSNNVNKEVMLERGTGYYLTMGEAVPVTFEKKDKDSMLRIFDENGKEVSVNTGKTYVCISPNNQKSKIQMN